MESFCASSGLDRLVVRASCYHKEPRTNEPSSSSSTIRINTDTCTIYAANSLRPLNQSGRVSYDSFLERAASAMANVIKDPSVHHSFVLSHDVLASDDGTPSSRSWSTISKMVSELDIPSTQKNIQWRRTFEELSAMPYTSLESRDVLITRILDFVRCNILKKTASNISAYGMTDDKQLTVCLDIKKEILLPESHFEAFVLARQEKTIAEGVFVMMDYMNREDFSDLVDDSWRAVSDHASTLMNQLGVDEDTLEDMRKKGMEVIAETTANLAMHNLEFVMFERPDGSNEICAICLDDLDERDWLSVSPCSHRQFHSQCIKSWLKEQNHCPLCRFII